MSDPAITAAKKAIVSTLHSDATILGEFGSEHILYGEPRNVDLRTVARQINVMSYGIVHEAYAVLSARQSNVTYQFWILVSFMETEPIAASDRWEVYDSMVKNALDGNPTLGGTANLGIRFTESRVLNHPEIDPLYHVLIGVEAKHRIAAGGR